MIIFFIILFIVALIKIKPQPKNASNTFLHRDVTLSISGIFAIIIMISHFRGFFPYTDSPSFLNKLATYIITFLGQMMVTPFLFYSGFGVMESFEKNGDSYTKSMLKNRVLKVYLSFFIGVLFFLMLSFALKIKYPISSYLLSFVGFSNIGNPQWYVVVIILLYLISYISFRIVGFNHKRSYIVLLHLILCLFLYFCLKRLDLESYWWNTIPAYFFGVAFSLYKRRIVYLFNKGKLIPLIVFVFSLLSFLVFNYFIPKYLVSNQLIYSLAILFFVSSLVSLSYIVQIKNRFLIFLGKNCFWIYMTQEIFMMIFQRMTFISSNEYLYFSVVLFATLCASGLIGFVFNKIWRSISFNKGKVSEKSNVHLGITITYITLGTSIFMSLFITPRILNYLGDANYGLVSFASSITSWLTIISSALAASYVRFASKEQKEENKTSKINSVYFSLFLFLSFIVLLSSLIFLIAGSLGNFKLNNYTYEENRIIVYLIFISGLNVSVGMVFSVFTFFITYKKEFIFQNTLSLLLSFLNPLLSLLFVVLTHSPLAIAIVSLSLSIIINFLNLLYCCKRLKIKFEKISKQDKKIYIDLFVFSSFILLNTIVDQINNNVDKTILGIMVNSESVTTYTLSKTFNTYLLSMATAISGTFVPKINELVMNDRQSDINELFLRVSSAQMIIVLLFVGGFLSCGLPFVSAWLGESRIMVFYHAIPFLLLDIVTLTGTLCVSIQRAMNKHKFRAIIYITFAIVNISLSILFVHLLPKQHAVWAVTGGTIISVVLGNWIALNIYNKKIIKLPIGHYFINLLFYIAIASVGIGASYGLKFLINSHMQISNILMIIIQGFSFLVVYLGLLFVFKKKILLDFYRNIIKRKVV